MTLTIVSPHLDDAVFSCANLMATQPATVITVFAGIPDSDTPATHFDQAAGFKTAAAAVLARRAEDRMACESLGATVIHLDHLDDQYRRGQPVPDLNDLTEVLALTLDVIMPLGLRHPDHEIVARACAPYAAGAYGELPYAVLWPQYTNTALAALADRAPARVTRTVGVAAIMAKRRAIGCYQSQLAGTDLDALGRLERYWALSPRGKQVLA